MPENLGVIQEQGFVIGDNLGFKPLSEQEQERIQKKREDNKPDESK